MAGSITFTGMSSSQDMNAVIEAMVAARRAAALQPIEIWKAQWETKLESVSIIDTALSAFYSTVRGMDRISEFMVRSASSSDTDVLTATASSSATPGSYAVEVGSTIKHRLGSDGKVDKNATFYATNLDTLRITVNGVIDNITFSGNCTLETMVTQINTQSAAQNNLVTASIIDDGSDEYEYRLVLTANSGGSSNAVSTSNNLTSVDWAMSGAGDRLDDVEVGSRVDDADKGAGTGTYTPYSGGLYTGASSKTFTFTATSANDKIVGTDEITFNWTDGANNGTVTFPSTYTAETLIALTGTGSDGVQVSLGAGDVDNGDVFTVKVWPPDDETNWDASIARITESGQYLGTTNKTFEFEITSVSGTGAHSGSGTAGTCDFTVHWTDGEGNSGDITFDGSTYVAGTAVDVFQGVKIEFSAATVKENETFSIDVWHPDMQAAQDDGMAKTEKEVHYGFSDTDTTAVTVAAGTFDYTYNGQTRSLTVAAGTTLTGLKDLINNDGDNPGITATIMNDGSGLSTAYHLVLAGNDTGAAYKITSITEVLDNFNSTFTETQAGQNAMIKIDSYPSGDVYIQKSTNNITDVIEGVTLSLVGTGTSTVTVGTDKSAIMAKAEDFRGAFNNVRSAILEATSYNTDTGESGSLLGNYAVQMVKSILDNLASNPAPGFRDPDDTYINLLQLGFYTDADEGSETEGLLLLDTDELSSVLDNDPDAVADVFSAYFKGVSGSDSEITFDSLITGTTEPNIYDVKFDGPTGKGYFRVDGETTWREGTLSGSSGDYYLTGASGNPEAGLCVHITYLSTDANKESEVRVKNGVVQELSRKLEDILGTDGPLENLNEHYNDIIDNMEDKIEDEEYRLTLYEERIRGKFVRLDVLINRMNQYSDFLTQFIANTAKK